MTRSTLNLTRAAIRMTLVALLAGCALAPAALAANQPARASLTDIENDVMCTSCREPLAVAQSPQANSERDYIRKLIAQGLTKRQIEQNLVAQYGEAVLGKPPPAGSTSPSTSCRPRSSPPASRSCSSRCPAGGGAPAPRRTKDPGRHPNSIPPRPRASSRSSASSAADPSSPRTYIASGALTPSSSRASAIVLWAPADTPTRNDSTGSGVTPTTRHAS